MWMAVPEWLQRAIDIIAPLDFIKRCKNRGRHDCRQHQDLIWYIPRLIGKHNYPPIIQIRVLSIIGQLFCERVLKVDIFKKVSGEYINNLF